MEISQHILEFARRHLEPYTVRGDELIPEHCPICHGGESGDKYTFALNLKASMCANAAPAVCVADLRNFLNVLASGRI